MKLVDGVMIKTVGGKKVAFTTGRAVLRFRGMIVLNETAEFIVNEMIKGETDPMKIAEALSLVYTVSPENAKEDVTSLIELLDSHGLIEKAE